MLADHLINGADRHFEPDGRIATKPAACARRSPETPLVVLLGIAFDNVTLAGALQRIEEMIESREPHYICTANVDFLVQARRDAGLRHILNEADLTLCDGT